MHVLNTDKFQPIVLKFTIFIYNSNSKIIHNFCNFCKCGGNTLSSGEKIFNIGTFRKNTSKYAKLNKKRKRKNLCLKCHTTSPARQKNDFFRAFIIKYFVDNNIDCSFWGN